MANARVLVVDDEPDIRQTVRDILEDEGYIVDTAESAAAAREARRQQRPDVVLLDIWMPDLDGISLLREWSERGGLPCPVIMISGHGTVETAVEATRLGAWDFIEKPISLAKLLLVISRALEASRLKRENEGLRRQLPAPLEVDRHRQGHAGAARTDRAARRARHLGADPRRARHRQGNAGARAARAQRAALGTVRHGRGRRDRARARRADAVRQSRT